MTQVETEKPKTTSTNKKQGPLATTKPAGLLLPCQVDKQGSSLTTPNILHSKQDAYKCVLFHLPHPDPR